MAKSRAMPSSLYSTEPLVRSFPMASVDGHGSGDSAAADPPPELDVPPMRILILLVGTLGDTLPFIQLALMMQERYGHVVRLATHEDLRSAVEKAGLRFYPLAGTAKRLAEWGPSFSLRPLTLLKLALNPNTFEKMSVMRNIHLSTIHACIDPDPADEEQEPWHTDAIIANPMALGHIHCAEALGVPLHFFFPNPWVATRDYPHSFSGWDYPVQEDAEAASGYSWRRLSAHHASYGIINSFFFHSFLPFINELRAYCRLRTLRIGAFGGSLVPDNRVPFSQMWSPTLSPRPADWPPEASVIGFCFWEQRGASGVDEGSAELAPLVAWLGAGDRPIYVGFGSMVFDGAPTARLVIEAGRRAGCRILLQTATSGGELSLPADEALPPDVFAIGRCSHDWLLPKMAAVVHHGGAGTTGAGLRLALPTLVCPFFGDQFFYGAAVAACGAGPAPLPFDELTVGQLAEAFQALLSPRYVDGARRVAEGIRQENGLEAGLADFSRQLPLTDVVCDVSTLMHEKGVGRVYYPRLRIKVGSGARPSPSLCSPRGLRVPVPRFPAKIPHQDSLRFPAMCAQRSPASCLALPFRFRRARRQIATPPPPPIRVSESIYGSPSHIWVADRTRPRPLHSSGLSRRR